MKALIIIDVQNDFVEPSGALAIKNGSKVVPIANRLITSENFDITILIADWHPANHKSFASTNKQKVKTFGKLNNKSQIFWPDHCVWGTTGAEFHKNLLTGRANLIIRKGMNKKVNSYSGFYDNDNAPVGLGGYLKDRKITKTYICGLALDYCVKFTALDSVKLGFKTYLIEDGCKPLNINLDDGAKAIREMITSDIKIIKSDKLIKKEE